MSYIIKETSVKQSNVMWYSDVYTSEFSTYLDWANSLPSRPVAVETTHVDENTIERVYTFASEADANDFLQAHLDNDLGSARIKYNDQVGITVTRETL